MKRINFSAFMSLYKSALRTQHTNTAQVTKKAGFSHSYLYNLLHNYDNNKYMDEDKVIKIGKGLGFDKPKINSWIKAMRLIHPINQQNGMSKPKARYVKKIRHKRYLHYHHKNNKYQSKYSKYHQIGHVIDMLHHMRRQDVDFIENKVFQYYRSHKYNRNN